MMRRLILINYRNVVTFGLCLLFWLNLFDSVSTILPLRYYSDYTYEMNPLANFFILNLGFLGFYLFKNFTIIFIMYYWEYAYSKDFYLKQYFTRTYLMLGLLGVIVIYVGIVFNNFMFLSLASWFLFRNN